MTNKKTAETVILAQHKREEARRIRHEQNQQQQIKANPWTPIQGQLVDWIRHQDPTCIDSRKMAVTHQGVFRINTMLTPQAASVQKINMRTLLLTGTEYRAPVKDLRPSVIALSMEKKTTM